MSAVPPAGAPAAPAPGSACFNFVSAPDGVRKTTPILAGSNPVGEVLLSTGLPSAVGSALAPVMPLLPIDTGGFDVHQALHRSGVHASLPTIDAGLRVANLIGEALATIDMRWLLAPDEFVVEPGRTPPATELDRTRSQRFVMLDGALMFREASATGVRFFGAGRTFPAGAGPASRVRFAGTATILEGLGMLKGATGTMLITGHVTPGADVSLSVVARLDHAALPGEGGAHGPLRAAGEPDAQTALFTLSGESTRAVDMSVSPPAGVVAPQVAERLRVLHLENDAPDITWLRSSVRRGPVVGRVSGPVRFDPTGTAYAGRLRGTTRRFTFVDAAGFELGSATAEILEGTAFREAAGDGSRYRLTGYGALGGGKGVLAGASGVVAVDMVLSPDTHGVSTTYSMRLADPDGRFGPLAGRPAPGARETPTGEAASAGAMRFVTDDGAPPIAERDRALLGHIERTVSEGRELRQWWEEKDRRGEFASRFDVVRQYNPDDRCFGFFDTAEIGGRSVPVMGVVQEMFYDQQKEATAEQIRPQLREFVLRYFMRVSHSRQPEVAPAPGGSVPVFLRSLSWLPDDVERRVGFGYRQLFYKRHDSGRVGRFPAGDERAIVDLRDIGSVLDWLVVQVSIYNFALSFSPVGGEGPRLEYPLKEETYLALSPEFIVERERPEPGVLAEYGFGYAFVPYSDEPGPLAYGPGHFDNAVKSIVFRLHDDGRIHVRAAFVVNRPQQIAKVDIDPVDWGFRLADWMTRDLASTAMAPVKGLAARLPLRLKGVDPIGAYVWLANAMTIGLAGRQLGITTEQLEKRMLVQHFMQHYELLVNSLLVWRQVDDWTDAEHVPEFCRRGRAL